MTSPSPIKAWILAARPQTLTGALAPIIVSIAFVLLNNQSPIFSTTSEVAVFRFNSDFILVVALTALFAITMQIDANFINDYFDFKKGRDSNDRIGPKRVCSQGWISEKSMKKGIIICSAIAILVGLPLIYWGGLFMIVVGTIVLWGAFAYTTKFSSKGGGDMLVIIFFGLVPVFFTTYLLCASREEINFFFKELSYPTLLLGLAMGMVTNTLLIINNHRDYEVDKKENKNTLVVKMGRKWGNLAYLFCGIVGFTLLLFVFFFMSGREVNRYYVTSFSPMLLYLITHILLYKRLIKVSYSASEYGKLLKGTGQNILFFSILFLLSCLCV